MLDKLEMNCPEGIFQRVESEAAVDAITIRTERQYQAVQEQRQMLADARPPADANDAPTELLRASVVGKLADLDRALREYERRPRVYLDRRDWWVGYYRGDRHHYVCPLPTVVIRWGRRS